MVRGSRAPHSMCVGNAGLSDDERREHGLDEGDCDSSEVNMGNMSDAAYNRHTFGDSSLADRNPSNSSCLVTLVGLGVGSFTAAGGVIYGAYELSRYLLS